MKKYQIIYADPAWSFSDRMKQGTRQVDLKKYYTPMNIKTIKKLPIAKIANKDCVLFLWTTDAHLEKALEVINAWGFKYKTIGFIWNKKEKSGKQVCFYGKWTCKGSEICLLASKGKANSLIKNHKIRQLVEAERQKHSVKPDEVRNRIVQLMGDLPRIELFAREKIEGWDAWGDEIPKDTQKLLKWKSHKN